MVKASRAGGGRLERPPPIHQNAGNGVSDIFQEVDEALREDRAKEWWRRWGTSVIGGAVAIVVAVAAYNGWNWYQANQRAQAGDAFGAALALVATDKPGAIAALDKIAAQGVAPYAEQARLRIARLKAEAGDKDGASAAWRAAVAGAGDADGRELAILLKAMQEFDSAKPEDLATELQPLLGKDRPWRPMALELLAAVALKQKDEPKAKALLSELRDESAASQALRERAAELLSALGEPAAK